MSVVKEFFTRYAPGADLRDANTDFRIDYRYMCNILYRDDLCPNDYIFAAFYHETKTLELHAWVWRKKLQTYPQHKIILAVMNNVCKYAHEHFNIVPITINYPAYWTIDGKTMDLMDVEATSYKFEPNIKSKSQPVVTFEQMAVLL